MTRALTAPLLLACLIAAPSCAVPVVATAGVTAVQAGTAAFAKGEIEVAERIPLAAAFAAAHRAMVRLEIPIEKESIHAEVAFVTARLGTGKRIRIVLERQSPIVTKFNIRVGAWGDESISRLVMAQIQAEIIEQWGPSINPTPPSLP